MLIFRLFLYRSGVVRAWRGQPALTTTFIVLAAMMVLAPILGRVLERMAWSIPAMFLSRVGYLWMAWVFWFFAFGLMLDLWQAIAWLTGLQPDPPRRTLWGLLVLIAALSVWGLVEARRLAVEELRFSAPVPEPVIIAQISDHHLGPNLSKRQWQQVVQALQDAKPDLIVSTGDFVDTSLDVLDEALEAFAALEPPPGKLAVTGNHEYYPGLDQTLAFHARAGFTVLRGATRHFPGFAGSGVDDPAGKLTGASCMLDEGALETRAGVFCILLKHQPVMTPDARRRFQLQLSGHTHGGQIFPFGLLSAWSCTTPGLHFWNEGSQLYVSRGSGTWGPPFRVLAAPEVTLVHLEPSGGSGRPFPSSEKAGGEEESREAKE